ncbi:hypothetical protein M407DRAFT_119134 [Tulasnella calospora MUT 4182]|uniref:Uncharacterized protein n=1 Tax=Tulasnella calospora MUT 4182 TaxID=1051891 RepID=A0A0C3KLY0_9AGAM|nr:hypothetical protein M407DRAFT_119134 [Tulasnella calospora MUT 4182]
MLERWSDDKTNDLVVNLSAVSLTPTPPAAAPPLARPLQTSSSFLETQSSTTKRGYIRVDGIPSTQTAYIHRRPDSTGAFSTTVQAQDRALVEIVAGAPPYRISLLNVKGRAWLALKWKLVPSIEKGNKRRAGLVPLDESGEFHCKSTPPGWAGPHRSIIWSIALDGTIQAWWDEGVTSLLEVVYRQRDHFVMFASDPDAYVNKYPEWTRARLAFEPAS